MCGVRWLRVEFARGGCNRFARCVFSRGGEAFKVLTSANELLTRVASGEAVPGITPQQQQQEQLVGLREGLSLWALLEGPLGASPELLVLVGRGTTMRTCRLGSMGMRGHGHPGGNRGCEWLTDVAWTSQYTVLCSSSYDVGVAGEPYVVQQLLADGLLMHHMADGVMDG